MMAMNGWIWCSFTALKHSNVCAGTHNKPIDPWSLRPESAMMIQDQSDQTILLMFLSKEKYPAWSSACMSAAHCALTLTTTWRPPHSFILPGASSHMANVLKCLVFCSFHCTSLKLLPLRSNSAISNPPSWNPQSCRFQSLLDYDLSPFLLTHSHAKQVWNWSCCFMHLFM